MMLELKFAVCVDSAVLAANGGSFFKPLKFAIPRSQPPYRCLELGNEAEL